jgi:hypothetical protein
VIRFAADENLNDFIVRGLLRRRPDLDIVRIRDTELREAGDPAVLEWAVAEGRVVPVAVAIEELVLIAEGSLDGEWEGQVRYLPLR